MSEKLVRMINQIAVFMSSKPDREGVEGFAEHLNTYWEPRMRTQFFQLVDAGAEGLHPLALRAAAGVRRPVEV